MTTAAIVTEPNIATTWKIDPARTRVSFAVHKRLLLFPLTVHGRFADVAGTIRLNAARPDRSRVAATIQAASITTGAGMAAKKRDTHLRGPEFLDVERFPEMMFESRGVTPVDTDAGHFRISGDLTIHGVTRAVEMETRSAPAQDPHQERLQFTATTTLNRRDFGLNWRSWYLGVGDELAITLEVEAIRA